MSDQLIDEPTMEIALDRVQEAGQLPMRRRLCKAEPDLHYEICRIANSALSPVEGLPSEAHDAAFRAVWEGVLLALEAYRLAHYRLWRETALGTRLEQIDPDLAK